MSEVIEITGGNPLSGTVDISGAKNAALPILLSTLLTSEPCTIENIPNLKDVHLSYRLLRHFGAQVDALGEKATIHTPQLHATEASYSLVKSLRASFWVLAPLLARGGAARVALPGGDIIGARPVDIHLEALTAMGADIKVKHGVVMATAVNGLRPKEITFRFPSVGATHQILMAAALTKGLTVIHGAAKEPEVTALADCLIKMGTSISGAGTETIEIQGASQLDGFSTRIIGDRIEAATYLIAGIASGGGLTAQGIDPSYLESFLDILCEMNVAVSTKKDSITVERKEALTPVSVTTGPFPEFATDIQAPLMALLCVADGVSTLREHVYEGRFGHVSELCRMGAKIATEGRVATITGIPQFSAAPVEALDIRAGAALVIAALAAQGTTEIREPQHIRRGYSYLERKLSHLDAKVRSRLVDPEDYVFSGC